jgi:hypothetical protein
MAFKVTNFFKDGTEHYKPRRVRIIDGVAVEESDVLVHSFMVGDAEDPDLIAGFSIQDWQKSESGRWVYEHCVEPPYWVRMMDHLAFGYQYKILARMTKKNETFFKLKFK